MANSDKNILITPSVGLSTNPTIKFNGANNTPTTLRVLDDGTISFEATAGQLFSISDGLTGSIFSVNDISGIPSIEVLDTGLVKLNQYGGSTVFGASSAIQNGSSVNAKVSISTVSATTPGLIIKGVSSQTANLQEWQDSAGNVLAKIHYDGKLTIGYGTGGGIAIGSASFGGVTYNGISNPSGVISIPTFVIKGITSQTASLQEWQNSAGTLMARVAFDGSFTAGGFNGATKFIVDQFGTLSLGTNRGGTPTYLFVQSQLATDIGAVIKGHASQTANLQEWQNSAGTVIALVDAYGRLGINTTSLANSTGGYSMVSIYNNNTVNTNLIIKSYASQTANLQEWQNSSGTVLVKVAADGVVTAGNLITNIFSTQSFGTGSLSFSGIAYNGFSNPSGVTTLPTLVIKGLTSQTGDLQQWQDSSGTVLTKINAYGGISTLNFYAGGFVGLGAAPNGTTRAIISPTISSLIGLIVQGAASQTANLQEWQNSAGTALVKIQSDGTVGVNGTPGTNTKFYIEESYTGNSGANTGLRVRGTGSSTSNWKGRIIAGGDTVAFLMGEYNSQAWLGGHNAALNAWASFYINPHGGENLYLGNTGAGGSTPIVTIKNSNGFVGIGTSSATAKLHIINTSASAEALIVKGATSQTANLQEWQNSSGTALARIKSNGNLIINADGFSAVENTTSAVKINSNTAQNADEEVLLRFHRSGVSGTTYGGGVDFKVSQWQSTSAGAGYVPYTQLTIALKSGATDNESANINVLTLRDNSTIGINNTTPSAQLDINIGSSSRKGLIVKAAASQTANLQEWQDSNGTVLTKVNANDGGIDFVQGGTVRAYYFAKAGSNSVILTLTGDDNIQLGNGNMSGRSGANNIFIANATTVPSSNPSGGGVLYVENGALKYRGSSGTVTTIANA